MNLSTGQEVAFKEIATITREMLKEYAEASGDTNPIHLDDEVAKKAGLPSVIAHGMLIAGLMANRALAFVQTEAQLSWRLTEFQIRFKAMTFPGDKVSVGGHVKSIEPDSLTLDLRVQNHRGQVTTQGIARFSVV